MTDLIICPCCHGHGAIPKARYSIEAEKSVLEAMRDYPLKEGQALFLGPASVAYLAGDWERAPWLAPGVKPPNGRRLPDQWVVRTIDWGQIDSVRDGQASSGRKATRKS